MKVIAKSTLDTNGLRARGLLLAIAGASLLSLTGCMAGGSDFLSSAKVDHSIKTGTIAQGPAKSDTVSDEATVKNAVTSADLTRLKGQPVPWANASTGSAGVIDTIVENDNSGLVCRQFRTTRHAYDGIANFYGKACMEDNGEWQVLSFQPQG